MGKIFRNFRNFIFSEVPTPTNSGAADPFLRSVLAGCDWKASIQGQVRRVGDFVLDYSLGRSGPPYFVRRAVHFLGSNLAGGA